MNWPDDYINKVICGDCLTIMKDIPDGAIDLVCTDPPYGIKKAGWDDKFPTDWIDKAFMVSDCVSSMTGQWAIPEYISKIGERYIGIIAGRNRNGMTFSPIGFGNWIPVIMGGILRRRSQDAFDFVIKGKQNKHPSQKPIEFMTKLINIISLEGDIILDPFAGSGTTLVAAKQLGRKYIGIEINSDYCKIAEDRLRQEQLPLVTHRRGG